MEIGVRRGIRITLNADGEARCRGASVEEALPYAVMKAANAKGEQRDYLRRWVKAARKQIADDELEARVDKLYEKEYQGREKHGAPLPVDVREAMKEHLRDQIRNTLKLTGGYLVLAH